MKVLLVDDSERLRRSLTLGIATAAGSAAELFRLLQVVVRVACITPGVAKYADVRKLAESVKLQKLLTKHAKAEVHAIDVKRVHRDQDRKAA